MAKKYLTIEDLYAFCVQNSEGNKNFSLDSKDDIVVQVPGVLKFESEDKNKEGLLAVSLQACHTGKNLNHTNIEYEDMDAALPSLANRPLLAFLHEVDGEWHFYSHNAHEGEDGELIYDEIPVGIIPESCNANISFDEDKGKDYVNVDGYIFEEYTKAAEVMRREGECAVSVELAIRQNGSSYDAKTKILNIKDFYFAGITLLGIDDEGDDVLPGMEGANIKLADFQKENNSMIENKLVEALEKLNENLSKFNIQNLGKEESVMNHFEELLAKYGKTAEEVDFETEGLSDEELDAKFAEKFGEVEPESKEDEGAGEPEPEPDEAGEGEYALILPNGEKKAFSLSVSDRMSALHELVNKTYAEEDNDYYNIDAYEENKLVVMYSWWTGAAYRQSYTEADGEFTLTGERVAVRRTWVTEDEDKKLDEMKSNYATVSEKLAKYEAEPSKVAIFASDEWKSISDTDEFKALASQDAHFDLSADEITEKLNGIVLNYAKSGKLNFNVANDEHTTTAKPVLSAEPPKRGRYGSFSKVED